MKAITTEWPQKKRELQNHHFDSTIWNDFNFRNNDIIIATYGKSGTTWVQQIIAQLIFNGAADLDVSAMSPWLDLRVPHKSEKLPVIEGQQHRRFIKTHLPVEALVFSPKAKYIYIGRDARDVVWSLYNHHANANDLWYQVLNDSPGRIGPAIEKPGDSIPAYFSEWLDRDGFPFWPFWENIRSWWEVRNLPNVLLLHFDTLKNDMPAQIRRMADFLDIAIDETKWEAILTHCSFDYMKKYGGKTVPLGGALWDGGAATFINKGINGRWKDTLSTEESDRYERLCLEKLGNEATEWLNNGRI